MAFFCCQFLTGVSRLSPLLSCLKESGLSFQETTSSPASTDGEVTSDQSQVKWLLKSPVHFPDARTWICFGILAALNFNGDKNRTCTAQSLYKRCYSRSFAGSGLEVANED